MHRGFGHNLYSKSSQSIKIAKQRVLMAVSIFFILYAVVIVRLSYVMVLNKNESSEDNGRSLSIPTVVSRADIVDRNGVVIATSLPTVSLYACPHEMLNIPEAIEKLASVFSCLHRKDLEKKITLSKKFLWIKRNLSPKQEQLVLNLGIPGVHFLKTERRVYPDQNLLAHVIGGTDVDNVGIAGIEKVFDKSLRESMDPITLSMDVKIQHAVHDELQKGVSEFHAIGGAAIVMEIATGEILSLVSLPDYDPNKNSNPEKIERFNMVTSSAIEPGSSAKIFNTAFALESGKITPFTKFDTRKPVKVGRFTIHDFKLDGAVFSVEEILKYSSNIGSAKIALEVGAANQKNFFKKIGFLDMVSCELPESQRPLFPKHWTDASAVTISYGHGIAFSPLHMITIFCGILNDGKLMSPTLVKRQSRPPLRNIISKKTSDQMKILLRINVAEGKNKFANVPGYRVGGKSGTAEKQKDGRYLKHSNYCGFIGAFPMPAPKYAVYVLLDDPKATPKTFGYANAGWNATPLAANIIKRIGPMLGIGAIDGPEPDWKEELRKKTAKL